jgi:2-keto-4-pentenoate hydratase/2-oxohepta-3-ene-1,7-dioic acid hydratase in catechol pathway
MKLVSFKRGGKVRIGAITEDGTEVVDFSIAAPRLPHDMSSFIAGGDKALADAAKALTTRKKEARIPYKRAKIVAPIPAPRRNIICVGKNYYEHAKEFDASGFNATAGADATPADPIIFSKANTTVCGPGDKIPAYLDQSKSTDYEVELAVIIGTGGRGISKRNAMKHVYGYTIVNDVTARVLQQQHKQWFIGKNIDNYCPMGPYLATADEFKNIKKARLQAHINGELRQNSVVKDLIFDIPTLISTLSKGMTLIPGDIIATGTPAGVGIGFKPPKFLQNGDICTLSIDGLGTLENPVG